MSLALCIGKSSSHLIARGEEARDVDGKTRFAFYSSRLLQLLLALGQGGSGGGKREKKEKEKEKRERRRLSRRLFQLSVASTQR